MECITASPTLVLRLTESSRSTHLSHIVEPLSFSKKIKENYCIVSSLKITYRSINIANYMNNGKYPGANLGKTIGKY